MASEPQSGQDAAQSVVSLRNVDMIVSCLLLALGLVLAWENWRVGALWSAEGPQSGYFPFRLAVILIAASLWGLFLAIRTGKGDGATFIEWPQLKRVTQVLIPTIIYVIAIKYLGIYVPSAIFVMGFMFWLGKSSWWSSLITGTIFAGALFVLFDVQFKVVLPKGPIEAYFGF
jgi:putative tricarboxylic transport membrane protein